MSRPKKHGLDYFTKNVNFYQDIKIRKLIHYKGIQAVPVYEILLCKIYASGYYLNWDEDLPFIISEISVLQEEYITDVIKYCLSIGLFDKTMFDSYHILTSRGIQERFFDFCNVAKRKLPNQLLYLLVDVNGKSVNSENNKITSEETKVNPEEIKDNTEETLKNTEKSSQSKVKESKEKHSTSADIRAREAEGSEVMICESSIDEEVKALQADQNWKELVFARFTFLSGNEQSLDKYLQMWAGEVKMRGRGHVNLNDAKEHFKSWLLVQEAKSKKQEKNLAPLSNWQKIIEKIGQSQTQSVVEQFSQLFFDSFNEDGKELIISAPSEDYARNIGANMDLLLNKVTEYFGKDVNLKFVYRNEK